MDTSNLSPKRIPFFEVSMLKRMFAGLVVAGLGLGAVACVPADKDKAAAPAAAAPAAAKNYPIVGEVMGFQGEGKAVILKHQDIPGLMKGMTMGFELADVKLGQGLKKGDQVEGVLSVSDDAYVFTALKKK
jgi:Cu/Ag efflux protein CusF